MIIASRYKKQFLENNHDKLNKTKKAHAYKTPPLKIT